MPLPGFAIHSHPGCAAAPHTRASSSGDGISRRCTCPGLRPETYTRAVGPSREAAAPAECRYERNGGDTPGRPGGAVAARPGMRPGLAGHAQIGRLTVAAALPRLPGSPPDAATRCLCHAVHLNEDLREYVLHTVVDPHLRAVCPAFGVNLVAVARHAALAKRRDTARRRALAVIRGVIVLAVALGVVLRSPEVAVGLLAAALAAAWGVLAWSVRTDRLSALKAVTDLRIPSEDQADPLPADAEDPLRQLDRANVIVYAKGEFDPFVGSGRRLHFTQVNPVDVTRPGQDSSGNKLTLRPFQAVDIHEYLARKIPAMGFTGLRAHNRVYVRGDYVPHISGLMADPFAVPAARVSSDLVKSCAEYPMPRARTYVCMERVMAGGQLVVAMYVRAWLEQDLLSIERVLYVLPPLQAGFWPAREFVGRGTRGATWDAVATATRRTLPVLAGKTLSGRRRSDFAARLREAEIKARRELNRGYVHDYGARTSLREAAAAYNTKEHFEEADVLDGVKRLSRRLLDCIQEFLEDHGVDTSEFKEQVQLITTQVSNIGTIQAGTAVVGGQGNIVTGHGAVNNFGAGQLPGQPGTGTQQSTP